MSEYNKVSGDVLKNKIVTKYFISHLEYKTLDRVVLYFMEYCSNSIGGILWCFSIHIKKIKWGVKNFTIVEIADRKDKSMYLGYLRNRTFLRNLTLFPKIFFVIKLNKDLLKFNI